MITKLYYSVQRNGRLRLMESGELCKLDQEFMDEKWDAPRYGRISIDSVGSILVQNEVATVRSEIIKVVTELTIVRDWAVTFLQEFGRAGKYPGWIAQLEDKLTTLRGLR